MKTLFCGALEPSSTTCAQMSVLVGADLLPGVATA